MKKIIYIIGVILISSCSRLNYPTYGGYIQSFDIVQDSITDSKVMSNATTTIEMKDKSNKIYINLDSCINTFPFEFKATLQSSSRIDEVYGLQRINKPKDKTPIYSISIDRNNDVVPFNILTEEGEVISWEILLNEPKPKEGTNTQTLNTPKQNSIEEEIKYDSITASIIWDPEKLVPSTTEAYTAKDYDKKGGVFSFLTDPENSGNNNIMAKKKINNIDKTTLGRRWAFGAQLGTDIGGAIPVPIKYIPKQFNPYPRLNLSIGARVSWSYNKKWSLHTEVTYKQIEMDADARVENQAFKQEESTQYFSGTAEMKMNFKMIEIPLYAKLALTDTHNSFLLLGGYYSYGLSSTFLTIAKSGYIGGKPDEYGGGITPEEPLPMDFTPYLDNWDAGIILGYERRIWKRANLGFRLMVGFKDIFTPENAFFDYAMWHMRGSVVLEYDLFLIK